MQQNLQQVPTPIFYVVNVVNRAFALALDRAAVGAAIVQITAMNSQTSAPLTDGTGTIFNIPFSLGAAPAFVRLVLLCVTTDSGLGMNIGDELDAASCFDNNSSQMIFGFKAEATGIRATYSGTTSANSLVTLDTPPGSPSSWSNFKLKLYWQ